MPWNRPINQPYSGLGSLVIITNQWRSPISNKNAQRNVCVGEGRTDWKPGALSSGGGSALTS